MVGNLKEKLSVDKDQETVPYSEVSFVLFLIPSFVLGRGCKNRYVRVQVGSAYEDEMT